MNKFWMVVRHAEGSEQPFHLRPAVKHYHSKDAFEEARRLAAQHPGIPFYVMVAFTSVTLPFEIKPTTTMPDGEPCAVITRDLGAAGGTNGDTTVVSPSPALNSTRAVRA